MAAAYAIQRQVKMPRNINYQYWQYLRKRKLLAIIIFLIFMECKDKNINKRMWIHRWIAKRREKGLYHNLFLELSLEDPNRYRRFVNTRVYVFYISLYLLYYFNLHILIYILIYNLYLHFDIHFVGISV